MTIKAVVHDGQIKPLEPLPADWTEGQELVVEEPESADTVAQIDQWVQDMDKATAQIPDEEHERFLRALDENQRESKDYVRREWGLS